ncbi:MAG: methylated-DNA--[protein]-cysteine S-methyltransferase [Acidimicrobiia bacterium]|nr:methylated-DNA--[protein]-cysteine S-methyltransferase [Acidimicrobiia bacterium]
MDITFTNVDHAHHATQLARFGERAFEENGPAQLAYHTFPSPIGALLAAVTRQGLVRICFESEDPEDVLSHLSARVSPAIIELPSALVGVRRQLDAYFAGSLRCFDLPLDRRLFSPFQTKVLAATSAIPPGEVKSYGQIAALAGRPGGAQATGQALGANPIPVVVPCHRVVAADGSLRGYGGGLERKQFLLDLERGEQSLF